MAESESQAELNAIARLNASRPKALHAAALNWILPGAGYIYCGRKRLAVYAWLFLAIIGFGAYASSGALLLVLLVIPGFGVILAVDAALVAGRVNARIDEQIHGKMKRCVHCSELVLPAAVVCKHCGGNTEK